MKQHSKNPNHFKDMASTNSIIKRLSDEFMEKNPLDAMLVMSYINDTMIGEKEAEILLNVEMEKSQYANTIA